MSHCGISGNFNRQTAYLLHFCSICWLFTLPELIGLVNKNLHIESNHCSATILRIIFRFRRTKVVFVIFVWVLAENGIVLFGRFYFFGRKIHLQSASTANSSWTAYQLYNQNARSVHAEINSIRRQLFELTTLQLVAWITTRQDQRRCCSRA